MFIFILNPFEIWDYYFELNLSLEPGVVYKSILYKKACDVFSL